MKLLPTFLGALLLIGLVAYARALVALHGIVLKEKPEWLTQKPSVFFQDLPRSSDPNVSLKVVAIALSSKHSQLKDPGASIHARTVRIVLPLWLIVFCAVVFWSFTT